jgi:hypothetical protein
VSLFLTQYWFDYAGYWGLWLGRGLGRKSIEVGEGLLSRADSICEVVCTDCVVNRPYASVEATNDAKNRHCEQEVPGKRDEGSRLSGGA